MADDFLRNKQAEKERVFWNLNKHLLDGREQHSDWNRHATRRTFETLLEVTSIRGKKILSAGCGTGQYEQMFINAGASGVVGVDIAEENIKIACCRNKCESITYRQSNLYDQEFEDDAFDMVVIIDALHHIQDYKLVLAKFCRWAKEFFCFEPNAINPVRRWNERKAVDCLEMSFYKWSLVGSLKEAGYKNTVALNRLFIPRGIPFFPGVKLLDCTLEKIPLLREFSGALTIYASR
jgi:ubiquinone/menaquinone biosynthesis C-methylase UbiE